MGLVDELRARNTSTGPGISGGGISSAPDDRPQSLEGVINTMMPFIHQLRNRNLEDYKAKALFDNNLSMQQGGIRRMDPNGMNQGGMDVVLGQNQNEITPFQRAGLGIDQQRLGLEKEKLRQNTGDERLALDQQKFGLEQQKNAQIYDTKIKDMERKAEEATKKLELATQIAETRKGDAASQLALHQAQLDATNARHALDLAQKDKALEETKNQHNIANENVKKQLEANGMTIEEIQNSDGTSGIKIVRKGEAAKGANVTLTGPDGNDYQVPADKVSDALASGMTRK